VAVFPPRQQHLIANANAHFLADFGWNDNPPALRDLYGNG
jgi:hypothetical protein